MVVTDELQQRIWGVEHVYAVLCAGRSATFFQKFFQDTFAGSGQSLVGIYASDGHSLMCRA